MPYFLILLSILSFLIYNISKSNIYLNNIDNKILNIFHSIQNKSLDFFFSITTWFGSLWVLFPLYIFICIYLINNGFKTLVYILTTVFLGAILTTYSIKYLQNRQRPNMYETIGELPFDPSFPSAHTTQVFIFVFVTCFLFFEFNISNKIFYSLFLIILAILVASSRIYLQVHFFTDVLAGFVVATIWIVILIYFIKPKGGI